MDVVGGIMKKGLAVIYDPHNLYQFVWYYCNSGKTKKWDALCLPNADKGEYMHSFCDRADIFENVFCDDTEFWGLPNSRKVVLFMQMVVYFIIGRRTTFCQKLLRNYVDLDDYDEMVVIADVGLVSGACVALGKEKKVVILEDGINDYNRRLKKIPLSRIKSPYAWQGFLLSVMGYCSPGWFELSTDKYCIKYASQPDMMNYTNYREIRLLYEDEGTDAQLFDELLRRIYPELNIYDFNSINAIVFTRPLDDFVDDDEKYVKRLWKYISKEYKSILLKKHPREKEGYSFNSDIKVVEVNKELPAEVLLPYLKGKEVIVVMTSSIMLYFKSFSLFSKVIVFDGYYKESQNSNANSKSPDIEEMRAICERFCKGFYQIDII